MINDILAAVKELDDNRRMPLKDQLAKINFIDRNLKEFKSINISYRVLSVLFDLAITTSKYRLMEGCYYFICQDYVKDIAPYAFTIKAYRGITGVKSLFSNRSINQYKNGQIFKSFRILLRSWLINKAKPTDFKSYATYSQAVDYNTLLFINERKLSGKIEKLFVLKYRQYDYRRGYIDGSTTECLDQDSFYEIGDIIFCSKCYFWIDKESILKERKILLNSMQETKENLEKVIDLLTDEKEEEIAVQRKIKIR